MSDKPFEESEIARLLDSWDCEPNQRKKDWLLSDIGRTLREFQEWLRWNRKFDRAYFHRESWYSPL